MFSLNPEPKMLKGALDYMLQMLNAACNVVDNIYTFLLA